MSDHAGKSGGMTGIMRMSSIHLAAASAIALSLAACSAVPDAAKPGFIYGSDAPAQTPAATKDESFPNLADVPDQAPVGSSATERKQIASALSTDRSQSQAGDVALRSGKSEAIVQSGAAAPGAAEMAEAPMQKADQPEAEPAVAPTPAPAPRAMPENTPVSEAPSASEPARVAAAEPARRQESNAGIYAAEPEPEQASALDRTANASPTLTAGTEPATAPQASAPAQRLAAVQPAPSLTPPEESSTPMGAVVPFPSRGGHARISDIKGGIELSAGSDGPRPDVVSDEDEASGARVNASPTTPVEVKPVEGQP